ncbi:MAG: SDR family NAD(P)-dependent oxidoreductase, partial [bacterium]|nr:SDR family NAD(P)-dependent oxidoreductase [bacterium]
MSIANRVVLVTGGSRGIGAAIALRLAREGASVAVNYVRNRDAAESVVEEIRKSGGRGVAVAADVGDLAAAESLVRSVEQELGSVDILVNTAAVLWTGELDDFDPASYNWMHKVNVEGLIAVTRAAAAGMKKRGWGRIVNISSIAE